MTALAGACVVVGAGAAVVVVVLEQDRAVPKISDRIIRQLKPTNHFFNFLSSY
jgi:hypothetical protein